MPTTWILQTLAFCFSLSAMASQDLPPPRITVMDVLVGSVDQIHSFEVPPELAKDSDFISFIRYLMVQGPHDAEVRPTLTTAVRQAGMGPVELFLQTRSILANLREEAEALQLLHERLLRRSVTESQTHFRMDAGVGFLGGLIATVQAGYRERNGWRTPLVSCGVRTVKFNFGDDEDNGLYGCFVGAGVEWKARENISETKYRHSITESTVALGVGRTVTTFAGAGGDGVSLVAGVGFGYGHGISYKVSVPLPFGFADQLIRRLQKIKKIEKNIRRHLLTFDFAELDREQTQYRTLRLNLEQELRSQQLLGDGQPVKLSPGHPFVSVASLISYARNENQRVSCWKLFQR